MKRLFLALILLASLATASAYEYVELEAKYNYQPITTLESGTKILGCFGTYESWLGNSSVVIVRRSTNDFSSNYSETLEFSKEGKWTIPSWYIRNDMILALNVNQWTDVGEITHRSGLVYANMSEEGLGVVEKYQEVVETFEPMYKSFFEAPSNVLFAAGDFSTPEEPISVFLYVAGNEVKGKYFYLEQNLDIKLECTDDLNQVFAWLDETLD